MTIFEVAMQNSYFILGMCIASALLLVTAIFEFLVTANKK